jgi:hypothetical protein
MRHQRRRCAVDQGVQLAAVAGPELDDARETRKRGEDLRAMSYHGSSQMASKSAEPSAS